MIFDDTVCVLGEGPLWHPLRESLLWFDINNKRMFERALDDKQTHTWQFDDCVSAAGWVSANELLIASEHALFLFNTEKGKSENIASLESGNPNTRSNDGRADPLGGFWIGTMGKKAEAKAGAIYRYYRGELRKILSGITIPNSICFSPDGGVAYFCDTPMQRIMKQRLDAEGWPAGDAELFANVAPFNPDGSVVDAEGFLWNAQWGGYRVARYNPQGGFVSEVKFEAAQISCPAFGGTDLDRLFATSATENLDEPCADDGKTFLASIRGRGQKEHQVKLG